MALKKYLDFRAQEFTLGSDIAVWAREETDKNKFPEASAWSITDLILVTDEFAPNPEIQYHEDEQRRAGSRSRRDAIKGRRNHGTVEISGYVRPSGTPGAAPQMATLYKGVFGKERVIDAATDRNVASVIASSRSETHFTVPAGMWANLAVGDGLMFISRNKPQSGDAHNEVRFVSALPAANEVKVRPGFRAFPITTGGTPDQVRGTVTYGLTFDFTTTRSLLTQDGHLAHQLRGSAIEGLSMGFDGTNPLKQKFSVGFREMVTVGTDQVRGDGAGNDSFLTTDTVLKVGDARVFEPGTWAQLIKATIPAGTETVEDAVFVSDCDYANNKLTVVRGTGPVSATNLMAEVTGAAAGPFDTTGAYNLDVNIDYQGWVTIDVDDGGAHGAGRTRATIATNVNSQLKKAKLYGFNVAGGVDVDWKSVASDGGTGVKLSSPLWGSQSSIQIRASATNTAHTLLGFAVAETRAAEEVRVEPWHPDITPAAETGKPVHNYAGWFYWNGYRLGITQLEVNLRNAVKWLEEEKRNDDMPAGFVAAGPRTVEVTMSGYFYGEIPALFYASKNDVVEEAVIQTGTTAGYITALNLRQFKVANPQVSGSEERRYQVTLKVFATSALEDELQMAFA